MARTSNTTRETTETKVSVRLELDEEGGGKIASGHGFLDHLLEQLVRHGRFALTVEGRGDLQVDVHHLVEDTGITLGQAFAQALGERVGIERYAHALVPMDESLAQVVIDLSGRPYLAFDPSGFEGNCHGFTTYHLREFLRGFCNHVGATIHIRVLAGSETHHVSEAIMKAFARALRTATRVTRESVPSTKGVL